jgi:hypothetical protein
MRAYKNFNKDLTCNGFQFEIGKTYVHEGAVKLCRSGFHFHKNPFDLFKYYTFDLDKTVVGEVEVGGEVIDGDDKSVCSKITLIKLIEGDDLKKLGNLFNNTGWGNSGNRNSGDWNSGNRNSGDWNSGNSNSGDSNSGDSNSGYSNSGDRNSSNRNSGNSNSGYRNSGYRNSGNSNSGNSNSGYRNSGDWNSCNYSSGFFNSKNQGTVLVFDKPCKRGEWDAADKPDFIFNINPCKWIYSSDMTDAEKKDNPTHKTTGGYLKVMDYKEAWKIAYDKASEKDRELLKALPNFDADVFREITGIDLAEDS